MQDDNFTLFKFSNLELMAWINKPLAAEFRCMALKVNKKFMLLQQILFAVM